MLQLFLELSFFAFVASYQQVSLSSAVTWGKQWKRTMPPSVMLQNIMLGGSVTSTEKVMLAGNQTTFIIFHFFTVATILCNIYSLDKSKRKKRIAFFSVSFCFSEQSQLRRNSFASTLPIYTTSARPEDMKGDMFTVSGTWGGGVGDTACVCRSREKKKTQFSATSLEEIILKLIEAH